MTVDVVGLAVLLAWSAGLAYYDWRRRRIPNGWLLAGVLAGLLGKFAEGWLPFGVSFAEGMGAAALAIVALWPLYKVRWMGAGDVKLCAVIGWLGGIKVMLGVFLIGSILGGVLGLALLVPGLSRWLAGPGVEARLRNSIPFGTALALTFAYWAVATRNGVGLLW